MAKKILITGITGLIGRSVLDKLLELNADFEISALIRPHTNRSRFSKYAGSIKITFLNLGDIEGLKSFLSSARYDIILHIGALRGGRQYSQKSFYRANVQSTEQLVENALRNKSRFIFCSSVGVFGAIPEETPANNETSFKADNYYHYTKISCEKIINQAILKGLDAVIIRPSITYGKGDRGFPHQLVNLVRSRMFTVSNKPVWMHLCHIDTISSAFVRLATDKSSISGKSYNVADVEPVQQRDLVNFIYRQIYNKNYPSWLTIDNDILRAGEWIARKLKNELWTARFELISHSWFYQVREAYADLDLPQHFTIPDINFIIKKALPEEKRK
ncbi:MAG: NAD(P)-dependent oxidoreductase [Candidatus Cloacimonadaceae bacterium]